MSIKLHYVWFEGVHKMQYKFNLHSCSQETGKILTLEWLNSDICKTFQELISQASYWRPDRTIKGEEITSIIYDDHGNIDLFLSETITVPLELFYHFISHLTVDSGIYYM